MMSEVRADVTSWMKGKHHITMERFVRKLHVVPCPNPNNKALAMTLDAIVHMFWNECKAFQIKAKPFNVPAWQNSPDGARGRSHLWHEMHSCLHTKVLGFFVCRVTSKLLGIGSAERAWGDVKSIKTGKRKSIGDLIEKRCILCTTARITEARITQQAMEKVDAPGENAMFGDDDIKQALV